LVSLYNKARTHFSTKSEK